MIVIMKAGTGKKEVAAVEQAIGQAGVGTKTVVGETQTIVCLIGADFDRELLRGRLQHLAGVETIKLISRPYKLASRAVGVSSKLTIRRQETAVEFNGADLVMMAGPCAVESAEQMDQIARYLASLGVKVLRGGAFKPRSSPYAFQGLGEEGLLIARQAADRYGQLVVSEVLDSSDVELVGQYADILQIGTRNMQNFKLLEAVGRTDLPVLLKRGLSATLEELLLSAEYVLKQQSRPRVILCLRGIRTFENDTRNTIDLGAIPVLKELSWLPVVVDPSHASGQRQLIAPMCLMAVAGGANGLLVEVHPNPDRARCDGSQSLDPAAFGSLYCRVRDLADHFGLTVN